MVREWHRAAMLAVHAHRGARVLLISAVRVLPRPSYDAYETVLELYSLNRNKVEMQHNIVKDFPSSYGYVWVHAVYVWRAALHQHSPFHLPQRNLGVVWYINHNLRRVYACFENLHV
jgi:hypothetical protein